GARNKLRELAAKKYRKGMSVKEIAELLEESETTVQELLKESEMR
ncbi:MAG: helix-turn-helix domain-containing protein, partial [[Clostridium] scindens]